MKPRYGDAERPTVLPDGRLQLAQAPQPASSLQLYRNGLIQTAGEDFTLAGALVAWKPSITPPKPEEVLVVFYRW